MTLWNLVNPGYGPIALNEGVGAIPLASILALSPELAFSAKEDGVAFQERTGASATTPSVAGDAVGSFKNLGTKGGWLTAPTDGARPIMRASGALRYLEGDGLDDILSGALATLRAVAGWTLVLGIRNTGSTGAARTGIYVATASPATRAAIAFLVTSGNLAVQGRRVSAEAVGSANGSPHANADIVATGFGDYTNTDAFIRSNGVQEGSNTSWLTAGLSSNDAGEISLFALGAGVAAAANFLAGRIYSVLVFPSVLSAADLALAERWTAQQMGITI